MKKNLKLFIVLLLFSFLVCFQLCLAQETQTQTPAEPINVSAKKFPLFDYVGITLSTSLDSYLSLPVVTDPPSIPAKLQPWIQQKITNSLLPELEKAGYSMPQPSPIFGPDKSQKTRFLIGGAIIQGTYYYHPGFWSTEDATQEVSVKVQWEVYDKILKKVIYREATDGWATTKGGFVTIEAIKISFRKFLSNPNLVSAIQNRIATSEAVEKIKLNVVYYTTNKDIENAPDKIKEAIKSVFTLKLANSHGSGFIINPEGYALTNSHVVKDISTFDAVFFDGKILRGEVIKTFPEKDMALVKLSGSGYPYLPLRLTANLNIGEDVFAIGTPADISLGLSQSVSKGVVSGVRDKVKFTKEPETLIQTDAAINRGNSGGPLVDSKGFVVGINSFGLTTEKGFEGLKFAISIDEAIKEFGLTEAKPTAQPQTSSQQ